MPLPRCPLFTPRRWLALAVSLLAGLSSSNGEPSARSTPFSTAGRIERTDPRLDELLDTSVPIEVIAQGFRWAEGPLWLPQEEALVLSDVPANTSYRWSEKSGLARFLAPSGYTGPYDREPHQGSNGMELGPKNEVLICQHGDRRVARLEPLNTFTTLADRFEGKRFNSPNDLVATRQGVIFFTDPPYGLNGLSVKPELDFSGVYRLDRDGTVTLVTRELKFPNGIALSPDERTLYIANSDEERPVVIAFDLTADARPAGASRLVFNALPLAKKRGMSRPMDGLTTDERGNLWASGPGGVLILSPQGELLGSLLIDRDAANCAFGGDDGRSLFVTASNALLRIRTKVRGGTFK